MDDKLPTLWTMQAAGERLLSSTLMAPIAAPLDSRTGKGDNGWLSVGLIAWSQDERSISYEYTTQNGTWYTLKANVNNANTSQEITSGYALVQGLPIGSIWQGNDGVTNYITHEVGGKNGFAWLRTDGGKPLRWD